MPTTTYDLIASNVLSVATASITFSSISASYRDLVLVIDGEGGNGDFFPRLQFNSDTASNYSWLNAQGNGTTTASFFSNSETGQQIGNGVYFSISNRTQVTAQIFDYSMTNKHKTILSRANRANLGTEMLAGRWASTSAINTIRLYSSNGNTLAAGTSIYLYAIVS